MNVYIYIYIFKCCIFIANLQKWAYEAAGFNQYGMKYLCILI